MKSTSKYAMLACVCLALGFGSCSSIPLEDLVPPSETETSAPAISSQPSAPPSQDQAPVSAVPSQSAAVPTTTGCTRQTVIRLDDGTVVHAKCATAGLVGTPLDDSSASSTSDQSSADSAVPPFLPWPPPRPSSSGNVTRLAGISADYIRRAHATNADIDERLSTILAKSGYPYHLYFTIPGGFAVLTPREHIASDGATLPESSRWYLGKETAGWSLVDYISKLFAGPSGRYRMFLFLVTSKQIGPASFGATSDDADRWSVTGKYSLDDSIEERRLSPRTRIYLFVYEFAPDKVRSDAFEQATNEALPLSRHLAALKF